MNNQFPVVLVGNTLAQMIAALEIAKKGENIAIVNNSKNWGGHFSPIVLNGDPFDAGMILFEYTAFNFDSKTKSLLSYNPEIRNDTGRFCSLIEQYISQYIDAHEIEAPKMYLAGAIYDDILIANKLDSMQLLPNLKEIRNELRVISQTEVKQELHASNKIHSDLFLSSSYETVSKYNHGDTFHNTIIEPYSKKLINLSTKYVIALYHRVPWLPLFYPETLLSYIEGKPQKLPDTVFSYPTNTCSSMLGKIIFDKIHSHKNITIINEKIKSVKVDPENNVVLYFENGFSVSTPKLGWGLPNSGLLQALGLEEHVKQYDKCSIALLFVKVPSAHVKTNFSVLNIIDENILTYRITNQTNCTGQTAEITKLVLEINPDYVTSIHKELNQDELTNLMLHELVKMKIITSVESVCYKKIVQLKNALMLPTQNNRESYIEETRLVKKQLPFIDLFGPASGFFSSSLNDQVVQGLKFVELQET